MLRDALSKLWRAYEAFKFARITHLDGDVKSASSLRAEERPGRIGPRCPRPSDRGVSPREDGNFRLMPGRDIGDRPMTRGWPTVWRIGGEAGERRIPPRGGDR